MKIALVTIQNSNNYGAMLQAYATRVVFSEYGEVQTINYDNDYLSHHLDLFRFDLSIRGVKMFIHDLLRFRYRYKAVKRFKFFAKEYLNITSLVSSYDLLASKEYIYDIYVCGSDQIWNPTIVNKNKLIDPIYFLSFAALGAGKLSYASSMGPYKYNKEEGKLVKNLLSSFDGISVREKGAQEQLSSMITNNAIEHVLDPTLLLSKKDWLKILNIEEKQGDYILVYTVPRSPLMKAAISYFSNELGFPIISLDQMFLPLVKVDKHVRDAGPIEFVKLFVNAKFVITDSFHGTCFALNFEKAFVSISPGKSSNRITSLFDALGVSNRMVSSEAEFKKVNRTAENKGVMNKLSTLKSNSLSFIKASINHKTS
ncbi:MAG: hypothetical protein COB45_01750 [Gammaproteobacteria bacterium]|nr:MAG: hypothetical protein COB45_01750 [Gammaproteobacteria bacterium]